MFFRLLPTRPVRAPGALYWQVTRRRVRARNRLLAASASLPFVYDIWISTFERLPELAAAAPSKIEVWSWRPKFSILLYRVPGVTEAQVRQSVRSVERQIYRSWELIDCSASPSDAHMTQSQGDYVIPLCAGDLLSELALFRYAEALQSDRSVAILYGDQDELSRQGGRRKPWFKPRWNSEMFLALDFLSRAVAIRCALASRVGLGPGTITRERLAAALLQATADPDGSIVHVPHILSHTQPRPDGAEAAHRSTAVAEYVRPLGGTCTSGPFGTAKVGWPLPSPSPKVSVIIPTKDKIELVRACVESVLALTRYDPFEVIVVDNGSVVPETLAYLEEIAAHPSVRVLPYEAPYNFSAINNFAARQAAGSFLCLLNNDTEVVEPEWLTEMMRYAVQPHVGAVGAKLLYEDGTIQHAGVVVGVGNAAGHAHRFAPADQPGYFRQPHVAQFVSAVTAACLVVRKDKYEAVGGLDERNLAVAFNDVDLCLKLQEAGWKNVYVPHAVLLHHESKSRGSDFAPDRVEQYRRELKTLQQRWGTETYQDPLHNPNLDRYSETYVVKI